MSKCIPKVSLIIIVCSVSTLSCGGLTNKYWKHSELVDSVFTSSKALYYIEGCENEESCGTSRIEKQVNRVLVCENLHPSIASLYKRPYKKEIGAGTSFTIKAVVEIGCWGLECTFGGGGHSIVVLEDSSETVSLKKLESIDAQKRDVCK